MTLNKIICNQVVTIYFEVTRILRVCKLIMSVSESMHRESIYMGITELLQMDIVLEN